jgi:20S proteasome alpha/beta subunit
VESSFKLVNILGLMFQVPMLIESEYALNAVNQGVTALGIKGMNTTIKHASRA